MKSLALADAGALLTAVEKRERIVGRRMTRDWYIYMVMMVKLSRFFSGLLL